jgi:hypothetical protein
MSAGNITSQPTHPYRGAVLLRTNTSYRHTVTA